MAGRRVGGGEKKLFFERLPTFTKLPIKRSGGAHAADGGGGSNFFFVNRAFPNAS